MQATILLLRLCKFGDNTTIQLNQGHVRFCTHNKQKQINFRCTSVKIKQQSTRATHPIHQIYGSIRWTQNERHQDPPGVFLVGAVDKSNPTQNKSSATRRFLLFDLISCHLRRNFESSGNLDQDKIMVGQSVAQHLGASWELGTTGECQCAKAKVSCSFENYMACGQKNPQHQCSSGWVWFSLFQVAICTTKLFCVCVCVCVCVCLSTCWTAMAHSACYPSGVGKVSTILAGVSAKVLWYTVSRTVKIWLLAWLVFLVCSWLYPMSSSIYLSPCFLWSQTCSSGSCWTCLCIYSFSCACNKENEKSVEHSKCDWCVHLEDWLHAFASLWLWDWWNAPISSGCHGFMCFRKKSMFSKQSLSKWRNLSQQWRNLKKIQLHLWKGLAWWHVCNMWVFHFSTHRQLDKAASFVLKFLSKHCFGPARHSVLQGIRASPNLAVTRESALWNRRATPATVLGLRTDRTVNGVSTQKICVLILGMDSVDQKQSQFWVFSLNQCADSPENLCSREPV